MKYLQILKIWLNLFSLDNMMCHVFLGSKMMIIVSNNNILEKSYTHFLCKLSC